MAEVLETEKKKRAAERAADYVEDGMTVGLGTGSTAYWAVLKLGALVRSGLRIRAVATSQKTAELAGHQGIPLVELAETVHIDLTIDGADEIDPRLNLIKGGGGALFREKMVALASKKLIIAADDSKLVERLGAFRVPVEIVPFGWQSTLSRVERIGGGAGLRGGAGKPFATDNGNLILDCDFGFISDPAALHDALKMTTGVVETGLFAGMADMAIVGTDTAVRVLTRQ